MITAHSRSFSVDTVLRDVELENRISNGEFASQKVEIDALNGDLRDEIENSEPNLVIGSCLDRDCAENEDFFEPQDSMSCTSTTDGEDCIAPTKMSASGGEFFDAAEVEGEAHRMDFFLVLSLPYGKGS